LTQNNWLTLDEIRQALQELGGEANWQDIEDKVTQKRGGSHEPYLDWRNYTTTMRQLFQKHCKGYRKYTGQEYFRKVGESPLRYQLTSLAQVTSSPNSLTRSSRAIQPAEPAAIEGLRTETVRYVSSRSKKLRDLAMAKSDGICCVCETDYTTLLEGKGVRVLQVHHRQQIAANEAPVLTGLSDLAVVCANCHILIHMNPKKALRIEELRKMLGVDDAV
jgi:predicted HNH restriction endonuclease